MKNIKRIFIAALVFVAFSQVEAQVTFRPGIRAGVNFSHFTDGDGYYNSSFYIDQNGNYIPNNLHEEFNNKTDFYVGFYGALRLTKFYTLQPEFTYTNQGTEFTGQDFYNFYPNGQAVYTKTKLNVSYVSVAMINKFNFNSKFNMHVGPTVDIVVDKNYPVDNDIDLAFTLGLGYNITSGLGIEARVKKGIVPALYTNNSGDHTNVVFSAGLTYTFDVK